MYHPCVPNNLARSLSKSQSSEKGLWRLIQSWCVIQLRCSKPEQDALGLEAALGHLKPCNAGRDHVSPGSSSIQEALQQDFKGPHISARWSGLEAVDGMVHA